MKPQISIGTDIIDIQRFRDKPLKTNQKFYKSNFTKSELEHCTKFSNPYIHLAGIFAAKEAIIKCMGKSIPLSKIQLSWNGSGNPTAMIYPEKLILNITISHTNQLAIAVAATVT